MIAGFSDFSLRVVYEAIERWEEIVDDAEAAGVSSYALESALQGAVASDTATKTAATVELVGLLSEVAAATSDASDAAKSTLEAAVGTIDPAATEATPELAPLQVLIAVATCAGNAGEPAKTEEVRQALKRVFKGYDWVAKYQALPGPCMGWQHLVDARYEQERRERDARAHIYIAQSPTDGG